MKTRASFLVAFFFITDLSHDPNGVKDLVVVFGYNLHIAACAGKKQVGKKIDQLTSSLA